METHRGAPISISFSAAQCPTHDISSDTEDECYPEGGTQAWLVVLGAWCAMVPAMGLLNTLAILHAWVSEHELRGMPESSTAWIFSIYSFLLYFCGAVIGMYEAC